MGDEDIIFDNIEKVKVGFEKPHQILVDNRTETTRIYTKTIRLITD